MKGGIAVLLELAVTRAPLRREVTFVFYGCEEVDRTENELRRLATERPELLACDAAVLCEPTAGVPEAGCQGSLRVVLTLVGTRAHTARPWKGVNAIHRLAPVLDAVARYEGRRPVIDGCEYREALQAVAVEGGVAGNVVPDSTTLTLNHRFAPDRSAVRAVDEVMSVLAPHIDEDAGDRVAVVDATEGAMPYLDHPAISELVQIADRAPVAKLGLTDVALFAAAGIPAVNYGPGDPTMAHMAGEWVEIAELESVYRALGAFTGISGE